jgi:hypothetical protein
VNLVAELVTASLRPAIRRKYEGRSIPLVLAAFSIILMMWTSPMVHAYSFTGTAYTAEFYRTGCGDLGSWIQARFTTDVSTLAMTIKETGTQAKIYSNNNGTGAFILGEFAQGYYYASNVGLYQFPGIDAEVDFRHYLIYAVNLTVTAPVNGLSNMAVMFHRINNTESLSANFSSAGDQLQTLITQNSPPTSTIVPSYTIVSSSGATLASWSQMWPFPSNDTNPPPYAHYGVSDSLHGLEKTGYAHVLSGTDFQIESLIHPYTATDFTGYYDQSYTYVQQFTIPHSGPPCLVTYGEDEGTDEVLPSTSTAGTMPSSNEAYQYVEVA